MSELVFEKLSEETLQEIAGGVTPELRAAYSCIYGEFGNGDARINNLRAAGYNPYAVQDLVNNILLDHQLY